MKIDSKLIPQRSSSSGEEENLGNEGQKMRLVCMLRQAYGSEVDKIPGFIEFAESAKQDCRKTFVESSAQTSYDLLETWFPLIVKRINEADSNQQQGIAKSQLYFYF